MYTYFLDRVENDRILSLNHQILSIAATMRWTENDEKIIQTRKIRRNKRNDNEHYNTFHFIWI